MSVYNALYGRYPPTHTSDDLTYTRSDTAHTPIVFFHVGLRQLYAYSTLGLAGISRLEVVIQGASESFAWVAFSGSRSVRMGKVGRSHSVGREGGRECSSENTALESPGGNARGVPGYCLAREHAALFSVEYAWDFDCPRTQED